MTPPAFQRNSSIFLARHNDIPLSPENASIAPQVVIPGQAPKYGGFASAIALIAKEEGVRALWKGLTPRLMRIMPGQAITFMTYEWVSKRLPDSITGANSLTSPSTPANASATAAAKSR